MKIAAHTLVKNEEFYIWYAVKSVIEYVDKYYIWDTGSTDNTIPIIKLLKKTHPNKISFKDVGEVNALEYTKISQQMLESTSEDWVIIVDGDEVWWDEKVKETANLIKESGESIDTIVNRYVNTIGDIYHYQDEKYGKYKIDNQTGNLTIRAMNMNIDGLHYDRPHGQRGIFNKDNILIQNMDPTRRIHIKDLSYMHFTHLTRSSKDNYVIKRDFKYKYSLGKSFPLDYFYPEVFFKPKPDIVPNVWENRDLEYAIWAAITDPIRNIKSYFPNNKSGY